MNRSTGSILHVEDDADDQYFVSRAFQQKASDAHLDAVSDGQSAIDFLGRLTEEEPSPNNKPRPQLVLLDLNLPRKSGLEVLKWIRGNLALSGLVVIVLTSSTSEDDMRQAYALGANAYVIKPADPTQLGELAQLVRDFWLTWNHVPPSLS
jgi:CheY-like chemotaxis protein